MRSFGDDVHAFEYGFYMTCYIAFGILPNRKWAVANSVAGNSAEANIAIIQPGAIDRVGCG